MILDLLLHVGHAVVHIEKAGDKGGVKSNLSTEDVLQVVQLLLHAVDVEVKILLTDLPVHKSVKNCVQRTRKDVDQPVQYRSLQTLAFDDLLYQSRIDAGRIDQAIFAPLLLGTTITTASLLFHR